MATFNKPPTNAYQSQSTMALTILFMLCLGCDQSRPLGRVTGHVTLDEKVCNDVVVVFSSEAEQVFMAAPVNEEGAYQVQMAEGFGLPLGTYAVTIRPAPPKSWDRPQTSSPVPERYSDADASGLTLVVESGENEFDIAMISQ